MKILYLSAHNPWPARSGGQVDIWNRLRALRGLGHQVHLVVTVKQRLTPEQRATISAAVDRLTEVPRRHLLRGLFSRLPVQVAVRRALRQLDLQGQPYDLLLLDNEFTGEVLHNSTVRAARIAIRVHNDEAAYQHKLAKAARDPIRRLYFLMEAARMRRYVAPLWQQADALWFISSDEMAASVEPAAPEPPPATAQQPTPDRLPLRRLVPAALDLRAAGKPPLGTMSVLFVGSLAVTLNQEAVRWYLDKVHPLLLDLPGYCFTVAGSTLGQDVSEFTAAVQAHSAVCLQCDVPDLQPLFEAGSVFVSPMRHGAGVKLKTVEAALRGLPLVSTNVGTEGSGLLDGQHCLIADDPTQFAAAVRALLADPTAACGLRDRAAAHILHFYNQEQQLREALLELTAVPLQP